MKEGQTTKIIRSLLSATTSLIGVGVLGLGFLSLVPELLQKSFPEKDFSEFLVAGPKMQSTRIAWIAMIDFQTQSLQ